MTKPRKIRRAEGIYQRGRDPNKLTIKIPLGRDPRTGKKRDAWHPLDGSAFKYPLTAAKKKRKELLGELAAGKYVEPSSLTVADHLRAWLRDHARPNVAPKTYERYEEIVEKHLIPALGAVRLDKLTAARIERCYSEALENGRIRPKKDGAGGQGLSKRTVLHHHRILKKALRKAVRQKIIPWNPADDADPPRPENPEMNFLDIADTRSLLEAVDGMAIHVPVLLAATTGMRRGEILGLRWCDVDLDAETVTVAQTLQQTRADPGAAGELARRGLAFKAPKTKKSRRTVSLYPSTVEALRRHRTQQAEALLSMGLGRDELGLVCALPDGSPRSPRELTKEFGRVVKRLGFDVRFHDLRHGHVSHCLADGMNPREIADRVGHASAKMTLDVYAHTLPDMDKAAVARLDAALNGNLEN